MRRLVFLGAVVTTLIVFAAACSTSSSSTTAPSPGDAPPAAPAPAPAVAVPAGLRLASVDIRARSAVVNWNGVTGATSYLVEIGTGSGRADFAAVTTGNTNTSLTLSGLPPGGYIYTRVRAQTTTVSSAPSAEARFYLQDYKQLTEALLLQTGLYWPAEVPFDGMRGWPAGTTVRIRLSNTVTAEQRRGLEGVAAQLGISGAPFRAGIEVMNDNTPLFGRNEIRVVTQPDACGTSMGCTSFADTSLRQTSAQVFGSAVVFLGPAGTRGDSADIASHEMAHALFGFWHVNYQKVPEAPQYPSLFGAPDFPFITMYNFVEQGFRGPFDRLSELELQVAQDAFRSGLIAGSRRSDVQARGLIY